MTEPLTPIDCDLSDFQFMPLDVARLRDSELASNEEPEACWAAVLLWCAAWHQVPAASVPDDDKWLAKAAGYGRIVKEWAKVRAGALRGWVKCSDGRLYHPVVAEKALDAWRAKTEQRWRTECARIKKHNERHHTSIEKPTLEDWKAAGCPSGQPLFVPRDTPAGPDPVAGETASNRQGEGQGQGQGDSYSEPKGSADAGASPPVDKSTETKAKPDTERRRAWVACGNWMVANGVAQDVARTFIGLVIKNYPDVANEAMLTASKLESTPDPKAYLTATALRLAGRRQDPVTVPNDGAAKTEQLLARQAAQPIAPPAPDVAARIARITGKAVTA